VYEVTVSAASEGANAPSRIKPLPSSVLAGIGTNATVKKHAHINAKANTKNTANVMPRVVVLWPEEESVMLRISRTAPQPRTIPC
jgi:hypothetical protein